LQTLKQRLLHVDENTSFGGHFRNYLKRKHEKPEFADHIQAWFPSDDLRIEYQRANSGWTSIEQGSQGQRSAALLAFLLAFGDEPLVLDQPEDDLDNHLIYELIVRQIRENKLRRQLIVVTHNPNVVVNGDAELVQVMDFGQGQCHVKESGSLQENNVRKEVCKVMEGGREAFARRWKRLGREV
jgi:PHP N-terminal domain protein